VSPRVRIIAPEGSRQLHGLEPQSFLSIINGRQQRHIAHEVAREVYYDDQSRYQRPEIPATWRLRHTLQSIRQRRQISQLDQRSRDGLVKGRDFWHELSDIVEPALIQRGYEGWHYLQRTSGGIELSNEMPSE